MRRKRALCFFLAMSVTLTCATIDVKALTLDSTEINEVKTSETEVYAVIGSNFFVTLPKTIKLDSTTKSGNYTVSVSGDLTGDGVVTVTPDTAFAMKQTAKDDVTATVTQEKTAFSCQDLLDSGEAAAVSTTGNISVSDLTSGHWEGILNFNVTTENMPGTDPSKLGIADYDADIDSANHTVTLNRYKGTSPVVTVKGSYTDSDGIPYATIINSSTCFTGNTDITDITVENGIKFVRNVAGHFLAGCTNLKTVDMQGVDMTDVTNTAFMFNKCNNMTSLNMAGVKLSKVTDDTAMFQYCDSVADFTPPEEMENISNFCFNHLGKWNATRITIPKGVKNIGNTHIYYDVGTDAFTEFVQQEASDVYKVEDGILYSADGTILYSVPKGKTFPDNTWEIPEGITTMNTLSFSRVTHMDKVVIPDSYVITDNASDAAGNYGNSLHLAIYHIATVHKYSVKDSNPNYTEQDNCIYTKDKSELIAVPIRYQGVVNIPEGTTKIHKHAFYTQEPSWMREITGINIPTSLTSISSEQIETINYLIKKNHVTVTVADGNPKYAITDGVLNAK